MKEEEIKNLLGAMDDTNISALLVKWAELAKTRNELDALDEYLRQKVKVYLKERRWERYTDESSKIAVSITTMTRESFDKVQLRILLTDSQLASVIRTTEYEKMNITTEESRNKMKNFLKTKPRTYQT